MTPDPPDMTQGSKGFSDRFPEFLYALSHLGKIIIWYSMEVYALFYLTDVIQLPVQRAGFVFLIMLVVDAIANLAVGLLFDRLSISRAPTVVIRLIAPVLALSFILAFTQQTLIEPWIWTVALMQITRIAFVLVDVPHNSLLLRLAAHRQRDSMLAALRHSASLGAVLAIGALNLALVSETARSQSIGQLVLVAGLLGGSLLFLTPSVRAPERSTADRMMPQAHVGLVALASRPIIAATLALGLVGYTSNSLMAHSFPYAATKVAQNAKLTGSILIALTAVKLVAVPVVWHSIHRFGVVRTGILVMTTFGIAGSCLAVGLASNLTSLPILVAIGLTDSGMTIIGWTLVMRGYARTLTSGTDRPSTISCLFTSMGRLGSGLSGLILSGILTLPNIDLISGIGLAMVSCSALAIAALFVIKQILGGPAEVHS